MPKAYSDADMEAVIINQILPKKSIFASKTFWLNLLGPVFMYAAARGINISPDEQVRIISVVMAVANIVVRFFTERGIQFLPDKPPALTVNDIESIAERVFIKMKDK